MTREERSEELYHIDEVVFRYQEGDDACGEEILRRYGCHPSDKEMTMLVGKYYKLLRYGKIDFDNRDTRAFIGLHIAEKEMRKKVMQWFQYAGTKREMRLTVEHIVGTLKPISDEDLKQDLRMLLLQQATRYKKVKEKTDFSGYIYNTYRYAVFNYFKKITKAKEPYMHQSGYLVEYQDDVYGLEDDGIDLDDSVFAREPMIKTDIDGPLGHSWVRGITCGAEFKDLTKLQRLIIKKHYEESYTDGEIASEMGLHINTIFKQRKKAKKIIDETIAELIEKGYYN